MPVNIDRNRYQNLSKLELLASQVVEGFITGLHKSPFHGFSVEFAEHRLYNTGESTRHIDWKLFARTDKLFLKRYEEETNLRCRILLDTSSSMDYPEPGGDDKHNKLTFSVYAAAALTELLRRQRDAVGISTFSDAVELHTETKSNQAHHKYLFNQLELLLNANRAAKKTAAVDALHLLAERIPRRSLVVIFSDMFDNSEKADQLFPALQHLKYNKHEILLFHVADQQKEWFLNFENRPYTFTDTETGEQVKAHPNDVKDAYIQRMSEFNKEMKLRCGQYGIQFVETDIAEGFNQVLLRYLVQREKMR